MEILKRRHFDDIRSNTKAALKAIQITSSEITLKGGLGTGNSA
jgi:hypothetical protein